MFPQILVYNLNGFLPITFWNSINLFFFIIEIDRIIDIKFIKS